MPADLLAVDLLTQKAVQSGQKAQSIKVSQLSTKDNKNNKAAKTPQAPQNQETKSKKIKEGNKDPGNQELDLDKLLQQELEGTPSESKADKKAEEVSWGWQILKTFLVLIFLIGFFGAIWKIYLFKKKMPSQESGVMQILYEYDLSGSRRISIVQLANRLLVLGVSDSGIQLITEITDKHTIDQIKLDCEKARSQGKPDFLWELTKVIKNKFSDWKTSSKKMSRSILNPQLSPEFTSTFSDSKGSGRQLDDLHQLRNQSRSRIRNIKQQKKHFDDHFKTNLQPDEP